MKILMFLLPVIIAGVVLGLGFAGIINIPGITPAKKKPPVTKVEEKKKPKVETPKKPPATPAPVGNPDKGFEAVAKLWNETEVKDLMKITEKWKDEDLSPILRKMDPEKVVEFLTEIGKTKPDRASSLTKMIQKLAESEAG